MCAYNAALIKDLKIHVHVEGKHLASNSYRQSNKMRLLNKSVTWSIFLRRDFSGGGTGHPNKHYKIVVAGGGAGGCSVAARAGRKFGKDNVAVVEPAKYHYYQPMWTLVGAGIKQAAETQKLMTSVLPKQCNHIKAGVQGFEPDKNQLTLTDGNKLSYDFLVIAMGIRLNYDKVEGLEEALKEDPMVCSNYSFDYVHKTYPAIQQCKEGHALFTFPNTPLKCPGAPQKIMYLAEDYWRKHGVRDKMVITYNTSLPVIFSAPKYAEKLMEIVKERNMNVNFRRSLKSIDHIKKIAVFDLLDGKTGETETSSYDFIHVSPPQSAPAELKNTSVPLTDASGFLDLNQRTLQHKHVHNIFGLGDCTNLPTPRTAAAVASQNKLVFDTLLSVMEQRDIKTHYDGYTSCPLVTSYSKCIMAEFDYTFEPIETFPFDQRKQRTSMFYVKKDYLPYLYWEKLLKGTWGGPAKYRKLFHLGLGR